MALVLTAVYMKVPEGYVAFVEEVPGANTQGATLERPGQTSMKRLTLYSRPTVCSPRNHFEGRTLSRNPYLLHEAPGAH